MRFPLSIITILLLSFNLPGQGVPDFKSDQECLKFIQGKFEDLKGFYFDSLFSSEDSKKLTPPFRFWQRIDLNGDKRPDLLFTGMFREANSEPNTAMVYMSNGKSYELIPIVRRWSTSFNPHVFTQKRNSQTVIIVHNYYWTGFEKVEDMLRRTELSRETCAGDDTLMYQYGSILDYSTHPSNISFDSFTLVKKYGWDCQIDSFVIYKNGTGQHYRGGCGVSQSVIRSFQETSYNISYLKALVRTINLNKVQRRSIYGGTDNNSATLYIYHDGKAEKFFDYGLESCFTFKAIYKYFSDLQQE
jgi:hypothetical protein